MHEIYNEQNVKSSQMRILAYTDLLSLIVKMT